MASEDGPADIIVRFRALLGQSIVGKLMDCFYCLSLWIAAPAALFVTRRPLDWLMTWLALSGAACLLDRLVKNPDAISMTTQPTEGELRNVLRIETHGTEEESVDGGRDLESASRGRSGQD
ncbi:MAG: DUF1360 domain-containing protein [Terracidiphilus sp.]